MTTQIPRPDLSLNQDYITKAQVDAIVNRKRPIRTPVLLKVIQN